MYYVRLVRGAPIGKHLRQLKFMCNAYSILSANIILVYPKCKKQYPLLNVIFASFYVSLLHLSCGSLKKKSKELILQMKQRKLREILKKTNISTKPISHFGCTNISFVDYKCMPNPMPNAYVIDIEL